MRAGGYTVHQALSADAAVVLKLALALARRRGHAQLTPLHVAFTLLRSSSSSPSDPPPFACSGDEPSCCAYGLFRRACVRAHPAMAACAPAAASHPLQCRALELCFNVALNRLPATNAMADCGRTCSPVSSCSAPGPTTSPSLSASLVQPDPTLSNALVAALKRAQANQRRGCIELQSLQPQPVLQPQQQPLLAIKVELDQLIISILDDPSVSRVMREAGFSSAAVKSTLEEGGAMLPSLSHHICSSSSSPAACASPLFSLEPHIDFDAHASSGGGGASWPAQLLHRPDTGSSCKEENVRTILEVMVRKQGARTNPVVVGDSVSVAEASVAELMRRLEAGDVPDELRGAHVLRLHLSCVHLRLMTCADVDAQVAELRRTANSIVDTKAAGLVIYVGDVRWAIDDDDHHALAEYDAPEDHMVAELARLLAELRVASRGRAWLVAAANYQTYMRCQQQRRRRAPPLEATWSLQPVVVPADAGTGLALGRRAPPAPPPSRMAEDGQITKLGEIAILDLALGGDDGGVPTLCTECAEGYEKEASQVRAKADGTTLALTYFPGWPHANEPQTSHKAELMELRRKWGIFCQRVHSRSHYDQASIASSMPWWCKPSANHDGEAQTELNPSSAGLRLSFGAPGDHGRSESVDEQGADTTLSLLPPDSAAATTTWQDTHGRWSEGGGADGEMTVNGLGAAVDAVSIRQVWLDQLLLSGDFKRKAEEGRLWGEPKRRRGRISLDLNICAGDDDDGGDSEEEAAPSDLTNEGGGSDGTPRRQPRQPRVGHGTVANAAMVARYSSGELGG